MNKIKTIFFGTPNFSVPFLESLINDKYFDVVAIISEPDRPSGRGMNTQYTPVKDLGIKYNIPVLQSDKVENLKKQIEGLNPQLNIVVAFGQIIPQHIIDLPNLKSINVHPSKLPKYRGPAPIQSALLNGDATTAVTIMMIDKKMDHGPLLAHQDINIDINDNYLDLEKKITSIAPELMINTIKSYIKGDIKPTNQNDELASYVRLIKKSDGEIDWEENSLAIHNKIRAFAVWPKSYTILEGKRLIFLKTEYISGKIKPILVQLEGKKPTVWNDFLNGYKKPLPTELTKHLV